MNVYESQSEIDLGNIFERQKYFASLAAYHGRDSAMDSAILQRCRFFIRGINALCILTLDDGYHSSGWFKNPDYETCWHLSLSFLNPDGTLAPQDRKKADDIIRAAYGSAKRFVWAEPPYEKDGKEHDVWHYRVFVDRTTLMPLLPRGEVYSKELTETGWKSFSEIKADAQAKDEKSTLDL